MNKLKYSTLVLFIIFFSYSKAQNTSDTIAPANKQIFSKKGEPILPESHDWVLSVDASPFLTYMGSLLSNSGSSAPTVNPLTNYPLTIGGKYFIKQNQAYRTRIRLGFANKTINNSVIDNKNTNLDTVYVKDLKKSSSSNITLSFGKEFRRGKTRLQGFYGAEGIIGISTSKSVYTYGNQFSNLNVAPTSTDFSTSTPLGFAHAPTNTRIQSETDGSYLKIAARGFLGAEYFIFPKMAVGLEFGFSIMYYNQNDGKLATETWDAANGSVKNKILAKSGNKGLGVDNDNSGGAVFLNFHF